MVVHNAGNLQSTQLKHPLMPLGTS